MAQTHRLRKYAWPLMSQEDQSRSGPQKMWGALRTSTKHRCLRALGGCEHGGEGLQTSLCDCTTFPRRCSTEHLAKGCLVGGVAK